MSNARYAAAYRARQSAKLARRGEALNKIIAEIGEPEGNKGRRILALATDALADPKPEQPK